MQGGVPPKDCPACGRALYPMARLRPAPALSWAARALLLLAGLASAGTYWWAIYMVRVEWEMEVPTKVLAIALLAPALVPGIALAVVAYRLPQSLALRCSHCPWRERFRIGKSPVVKDNARRPMARGASATAFVVTHDVPAPPIRADGAVVDDMAAHRAVGLWVYEEFASGRTAEELTATLTAAGWDPDEAAVIVEQGRRATRHKRGARTRDDVVRGLNDTQPGPFDPLQNLEDDPW